MTHRLSWWLALLLCLSSCSRHSNGAPVPLETEEEPTGLGAARGVFEYDPGEPYGLNETSQLSQTTILTTLRGAEQGNRGEAPITRSLAIIRGMYRVEGK